MDRKVDVLLVGGGVASAAAAETLRHEGFEGSILLVGRELDPPYHRPPISKEYLRGETSREQALIRSPDRWHDAGIETLTRTSVLDLDTGSRSARLSTKESVGFDQALIATGAMVRRLDVAGSDLDGIHYLRTLRNADAIRRDAAQTEHTVCVGGSYIATEVAASLTELGHSVSLVMQESEPLERQFGSTAGRFFRRVLEAHGIEIIANDEVERFEGTDDRVSAVLTKAGRKLSAETVVCGVGVAPDVMLARKSGLTPGELGGVACDSQLRTSAPGVFCAGDACEYESVVHGRKMRVEHEEVATAQGSTAARNMLGAGLSHTEVPYFFSDLSDWVSLEYLGPAPFHDSQVVRGGEDRFSIWYLADGKVCALLSVEGHGNLETARELITSGQRVEPSSL